MKNLILMLALFMPLSGCALFGPTDEVILRAIRKDVAESLRPALVDALDNANKPDGSSLYIEPYKNEKVNLADRIILSIDRIYPPVDEDGNPMVYWPEPVPWGND